MDHTKPSSSRCGSADPQQGCHAYVAELFQYFLYAITMKHILALYREMCRALNLRANRLPEFYPILKSKLGKNWRADGIFKKLDAKIANNIYGKNILCRDTRVLVIGAGPCGLRAAIECQLLGAKVVVLEKRDRMSRHNVLHLWPFVVEDLISLGAKRYFPRFCSGPIDHISIRQLQYMLLKVALLLGVEFFESVAFEELLDPTVNENGENTGWKVRVTPSEHPVSLYEFDVLIGADGKRNTLKGFKRSEFRGKLAIGITVNFIHRRTQLEASVPELSGRSYHFHQDYFNELTEKTGIELENIVYYKGDTHYFVMTAKKTSLLRRKVLKEDFTEVSKLLSIDNVDNKALLEFARDAAQYAVNYKLPLGDFALNHYLEPDCALFDFTTFYAAENACVIFEMKGYSLLCQLVGDSLLEPFWPTGSGCARGFLSALDAAWQIRSWGMTNTLVHPVDLIAERECLYKFLPYTDPNNMCVRINKYTIDPTTRYLTKDRKELPLARCKALYQSDDPAPMDAPRPSKRPMNLPVPDNVLLRWAAIDEEEVLTTSVLPSATSRILRCYRPDLVLRSGTHTNATTVLAAKFNIQFPPMNADSFAVREYLTKIYHLFKGEVPHVPVYAEKEILQQIRSRPTTIPKYSFQTMAVSKSSDKERKQRKRRCKMPVSKSNYSDYICKKIGRLNVDDISKLARLIDGHDTLQNQDEHHREKQKVLQEEIANILQSDMFTNSKHSRAQLTEIFQGSLNDANQSQSAISHYFRGKKEHGKKTSRKLKGLDTQPISSHYFGDFSNGQPYENTMFDNATDMSSEQLECPTETSEAEMHQSRPDSPDLPIFQRRSNSIAAPETVVADLTQGGRYDYVGNPDKAWRRQRMAEIVAGHETHVDRKARSKRSNSVGTDMAQKMQKVVDLMEGRLESSAQNKTSSLALRMRRVSGLQGGLRSEESSSYRHMARGMARERFESCKEMLCAGPAFFTPTSTELEHDVGLQQYRAEAPQFDERVRLLERQLKQSEDMSVESSPKKKLYSKGRVQKLAAELADQKEPTKQHKQKPKDLLRAIGKIEPSDWHLRQLEKKIRDNQLGRPAPKTAERVPQWDKVQFLERQQRLKEVDVPPPTTTQVTEVKYKDLPDQGTKKVASLADKFRQSTEQSDKSLISTCEKTKTWIGSRVLNVRCVVCKKVVFHAESANADGMQVHKNCFRCTVCNTNLRPGNFRVQRSTDAPSGPVKILCLKHSTEPTRAPPPRIAPHAPRGLTSRDSVPKPIPTPPPDQECVQVEITTPATSKRLSWTGAMSATPPRQCDEDEWTDLNNLASDMFVPNSDLEDSSSDYEDALSDEENVRQKTVFYAPESVLFIRPRHDPTDDTAGYDDMSDDGGSSSGASCSRMREAREARRREVPPAVEMLGASDSSEEVESEDDDEISDEESSATEVSTDSEFAREENGPAPSPPAITVTEAPPLSLPPLVPDSPPARPPQPRPAPDQDYPLSRTRSTGGIATRRALELKKRYLLGDPSTPSVKKSDSTSRLDVKLQMVQSSISEFQKLLNPAPVTPPVVQALVAVNITSPIETDSFQLHTMTVEEEDVKEPIEEPEIKCIPIPAPEIENEATNPKENTIIDFDKDELDTDTLSEDESSTIGKGSQGVPRVEVHDAAGELLVEVHSEDDVQSSALTETELSDWAADSAVDDCMPDSVFDKHTRTNKSPRVLAGPKIVYDSSTAPMHVCGKEHDPQLIAYSNALEHFEFADEGEPDLVAATAVNRGFMELVLDNRADDNDRSMEFIEKQLTDTYLEPADTSLHDPPDVVEELPLVVSTEPLIAFADGLDSENNYRRLVENNNERSPQQYYNGTKEIASENTNLRLQLDAQLDRPIYPVEPTAQSLPDSRTMDSVDVRVQEVKRKKDEETEIVRQLVLGKHGNMNRRAGKKIRPVDWSVVPPPVPPLPSEFPPPPPPPMPANVELPRVVASASDPDLAKKNNFLKALLHLPQRIYLRTKDSSWSSSATHKSTGALSPPPVPAPPRHYRPRDPSHTNSARTSGSRSSGGDAASEPASICRSSPTTSHQVSGAVSIDSPRISDLFMDAASHDRRLEQIEKKLIRPHKMTPEEQAAAVAMLVEIKAQKDAHQALRTADRQRGAAGGWDCRYK